jgi:hypothetical protein
MKPLRRLLPLVVVAALVLLARESGRASWPQFRGTGGMGVSTEKDAPAKWGLSDNIAWQVNLPGPGTSSPIIIGDKVILTCYSGFNLVSQPRGNIADLKRHLVCLDRKTGNILWETKTPAKQPEQETIRDSHGYASSTPICDGQRIYVFYGKSGVFAFDMNGKEQWQADVGSTVHGWGSAASPVLFEDLVIVNASVESESLVALDKKTGKERWRARGIRESWNTPILVDGGGDKKELVVAIMGKVLAFDPRTGTSLWSCATDIGWYMVPSLVAEGDMVYCIGGRTGGGLAVRAGGKGDVTKTHRVWTMKKGSNVTSPIFHEGKLYWMHEGLGIAYCVDARTGEVVYEKRVERFDQVYASPVLAAGRIYYTSRTGRTLVIAAKPTYEEIATNDLRDRSLFHASPAVSSGQLFIRSDKALYCIGKK